MVVTTYDQYGMTTLLGAFGSFVAIFTASSALIYACFQKKIMELETQKIIDGIK